MRIRLFFNVFIDLSENCRRLRFAMELSLLLLETLGIIMMIQESGNGQSEWERIPHAHKSALHGYAKEVGQGQGNDKIGYERYQNDGPDVCNAAQSVAERNLKAIAKLIDNDRNDRRCHNIGHFIGIGKEESDVVSINENGHSH